MIPARYQQIVFGLVLSGLMSLLVSGITTLRTVGWIDGFAALWLSNWLSSWAVAFPAVLVVAPVTRRIVGRLVRPERRASDRS
ncbi:DUF2798 domain-containing protein [uncultured Roseobacter sp.]|uniref:DUF2798 domain-containing protein n=1 Tax=uncultured Roseobacter sp. TaxID=114847 RepID=UPI002625F876|nr:DUF2798 domain-containing protein [uncultured Roseobacter sp.]